ncbi:2-amino-4-hydroxy-6-hydroxymethyldihydropteridine diphosphokinase [Legionella dresdenensis]|uniref:2-amino-4-hydroxy-6-hydroxymethyldihydropteridine pyrophosphokinase n=1 Tax=Legionella dresdenensis TaxID=450200 RepID=A0ABV8CBC8_9GAMM
MTLCYLALGSNLKTSERQIRLAIARLRTLPSTRVLEVAELYKNKAWGRRTQPNFCNTVVSIRTNLTPEQLLAQCKKVENRQGRYRRVKYGARTLDVDILFYGNRKINKPDLIIPHPRLHERDFVLIPLQQLLRPAKHRWTPQIKQRT